MTMNTTITNDDHLLGGEKVGRVKRALVSEPLLYNMAEIFKVLSDPARLKIVLALRESELCVNDLADLTSLSQSSVSHHLKTLRQTRLVNFRRVGKSVHYALADDHVTAMLIVARDHAGEPEQTNT